MHKFKGPCLLRGCGQGGSTERRRYTGTVCFAPFTSDLPHHRKSSTCTLVTTKEACFQHLKRGTYFEYDSFLSTQRPDVLETRSNSTTGMATATMTATAVVAPKKKGVELALESERFLRCCADVANALIEDHESQKNGKPSRDINLNSLRAKLAKKHKLANIPPLTAIIAAIPEHYKKYILHKLIAKPIRTIINTFWLSQ